MKCLSLWQPWASLIVIGAKRFETRSWETLYRGPLLIHAAKKWSCETRRLCSYEPFLTVMDTHGIFPTFGCPVERFLPFGCLLGVVDLVECFYITDAIPGEVLMAHDLGGVMNYLPRPTGNEREFGDFSPGRFAWQLENVRRFPSPIPYIGHQGIFNVDDDLVADQLEKGEFT
jgi:hypothetical protein